MTWTGSRWVPGGDVDHECRISGFDDDIVRLMLRRWAIGDRNFTIDDPHYVNTLFERAIRALRLAPLRRRHRRR